MADTLPTLVLQFLVTKILQSQSTQSQNPITSHAKDVNNRYPLSNAQRGFNSSYNRRNSHRNCISRRSKEERDRQGYRRMSRPRIRRPHRFKVSLIPSTSIQATRGIADIARDRKLRDQEKGPHRRDEEERQRSGRRACVFEKLAVVGWDEHDDRWRDLQLCGVW
jgi:hypothetical protein